MIREVKIENEKDNIGEVVWDGKDEYSMKVSKGVYFVKIDSGGEVGVRKVVSLR